MASCSGVGAGRVGGVGAGAVCAGSQDAAAQKTRAKARAAVLQGFVGRSIDIGILIPLSFPI